MGDINYGPQISYSGTFYWDRATHIPISKPLLVQIMVVACLTPSHYQNLCFIIANWTHRNKLWWYSKIDNFVWENNFENVVCKEVTTMPRPQRVKYNPDKVYNWTCKTHVSKSITPLYWHIWWKPLKILLLKVYYSSANKMENPTFSIIRTSNQFRLGIAYMRQWSLQV